MSIVPQTRSARVVQNSVTDFASYFAFSANFLKFYLVITLLKMMFELFTLLEFKLHFAFAIVAAASFDSFCFCPSFLD